MCLSMRADDRGVLVSCLALTLNVFPSGMVISASRTDSRMLDSDRSHSRMTEMI